MKTGFGILFDYNGVLADDEPLHEAATRSTLLKYGFELNHATYDLIFKGRTDKDGFESLRAEHEGLYTANQIPRLVLEKQSTYLNHVTPISVLYPDVRSVVEKLQGEFVLGIVTGSSRSELTATLRKEGLSQTFTAIVTAEDVKHGKPNPEGYLLGLRKLGLPGEHVLVVEDTPSGVRAAKAANLRVAALLHTTPKHQLTEADHIISSIRELSEDFVRKALVGKQ